MTARRETRVQAWLHLVRAPNLLSVPGDPLAGLCVALASGSAAPLAAGFRTQVLAGTLAAVAAYAGGLVDNDLVDLERDRRERPERPLPSGQIALPDARRLRLVLLALPLALGLAAGLPAAWFGGELALLAAILAYNRLKARCPAPAFLLMGLCRGLSLLSGALLLGPAALHGAAALWGAFALWTLYVAGLTAYASTEHRRGAGRRRHLLLLPFLPALPFLFGALPRTTLALPALAGAAAAGGLCAFLALRDCGPGAEPDRAQRAVGRLIRALFPMQACACLAVPAGRWAVLPLLAAWLAARRLARRYAPS